MPLLSIIIPTFNSGATLVATLKSVCAQTFTDYECWVIDGGSTDHTIDIVRDFRTRHPSIRYASGKDNGVYDAMNKGIDQSIGKFLYFLGSDDVFYSPSVLDEVFSSKDIEQYDFIYGNVKFRHSGIKYGEQKDYFKLIRNLENISHQSIFYSRRIFDIVGKYDLNFPIYADFNLNVKCFEREDLRKHYIDKTICIFNEKGMSYSQRNRDSFIKDLHRSYIENHENPVALYATSRYLEKQLSDLQVSKDYRLGMKLGNFVRQFRKLLRLNF